MTQESAPRVVDPFELKLAVARELLEARAPEASTIPVDLDQVSRQFGIGPCIIEPSSASRHGALRREGGRFRPVVYRSGSPEWKLSSFERFTVAHEIAHAVIEQSTPLRPSRNREYWMLEAICDEFAARLLLPIEHVLVHIEDDPSAFILLHRILALARAAETSLVATARRLIGQLENTGAWGIVERLREGEDRIALSVKWDVENPVKVGLRRPAHVPEDHPLHAAVRMLDQRAGAIERISVGEGTEIVGRRMSSSFVLCVVKHG